MSTITVRPHCGATGSSRGMEVTLGTNTRITTNAKAATRVVVATVKALFVAGHKSADVKQYNATGKCLEHKRFYAVGGSKVISAAKPEAKAAPAKPKAGKPAATGNTRVNALVASGYDLATARKLAAAEQGKPAPAAKPRKAKARKPKAAAAAAPKPAAKPKARKPKAAAATPAKKAAAKKTAGGTAKRKPSAYNKFVKAHFKANANATMKSAAAAWKKSQGGAAAKPKAKAAKAKGAKAASAGSAPKARTTKTRTTRATKSASAAKGTAAKPKATKGKRGSSKNPWIATVKRHWPSYKAQGWAYKDFLSDLGTRKAAGESL